jgi:molybdopterin synthase sulfur carrier subunit
MKINILLAKVLTRFTNNNKEIVFELDDGNNLLSLIDSLDRKFPGLKEVLCDPEHEIVAGINIYVNGDNVRYLEGLKTILKNEDQINIIPAAAAG